MSGISFLVGTALNVGGYHIPLLANLCFVLAAFLAVAWVCSLDSVRSRLFSIRISKQFTAVMPLMNASLQARLIRPSILKRIANRITKR